MDNIISMVLSTEKGIPYSTNSSRYKTFHSFVVYSLLQIFFHKFCVEQCNVIATATNFFFCECQQYNAIVKVLSFKYTSGYRMSIIIFSTNKIIMINFTINSILIGNSGTGQRRRRRKCSVM